MKIFPKVHLGTRHTRQSKDRIEEISFRHELESELALSSIESGLFPFTKMVDNKKLLNEVPEVQIHNVLWSLDKNNLTIRWDRDSNCQDAASEISNIKIWWTTNKKPELKNDWCYYQNSYKIPSSVIEGERVDVFFEVFDAKRNPLYLISNAFSVQVIRRDKSKDDSGFFQYPVSEEEIAEIPDLNHPSIEPNAHDMGLRAYLDNEHIQLVWARIASKAFSVEKYTLLVTPEQVNAADKPSIAPWIIRPAKLKGGNALYQGIKEGVPFGEVCGQPVVDSATYMRDLVELARKSISDPFYQQSPEMVSFIKENISEDAMHLWDDENEILTLYSEWDLQYTKISTGEIIRKRFGGEIRPEDLGDNPAESSMLDRKDLIVSPTVRKIHEGAFIGWNNAGSINLLGGGIVEARAFKDIPFQSFSVGPKVLSLGAEAIRSPNAQHEQTITFSPGLISLDTSAITKVNVKALILPETLKEIKTESIADCPLLKEIHLGGLEEINVPHALARIGSSSANPIRLNMGQKLRVLGESALGQITKGGELIISPVLEQIGDFALIGWGEAWGKTYTQSGSSAVGWLGEGSQSPWGLTLPATVRRLGNSALSNARFKDVTLQGNSALTLGTNALGGCTAESLIIGTMAQGTSSYCFQDMHLLKEVNLGQGITNLYGEGVFSRNKSLERIHIPAGTRRIRGGLFNDCPKLVSITIAEGLLEAGNETNLGLGFIGAENLQQLVYPNTLKKFNEDFSALPSLHQLYIGGALTVLNLNRQQNLEDIFIASDVVPALIDFNSPAWVTFHFNHSVNWMANPSITELQKAAFRHFPVQDIAQIPQIEIEVHPRETPWTYHFTDLKTNQVIYVDSDDTIDTTGFVGFSHIDDLVINTGAKIIANQLFQETQWLFPSLKRMKALSGLTSLGKNSLAAMKRLKYIDLPDTVNRIGENVFAMTGARLKRINMPKVGYRSIHAQGNPFADWSAHGFDVPTSHIMPINPYDLDYYEGELSGRASPDSTVVIKSYDSSKTITTPSNQYGTFAVDIPELVEISPIVRLKSFDAVLNQSTEQEEDLTPFIPQDWQVISIAERTHELVTYIAVRGPIESYVGYDLTPAVTRSLSDPNMQQWQAVKDACNELTGGNPYTWDTTLNQILYVPSFTCATEETCPADAYYLFRRTPTVMKYHTTTESACSAVAASYGQILERVQKQYDHLGRVNGGLCVTRWPGGGSDQWGLDSGVINPFFDPAAPASKSSVPFQEITQKIIANAKGPDQGKALLADAYIEEVAKSVLTIPEARSLNSTPSFIEITELSSGLEANIYRFGATDSTAHITDQGINTQWKAWGYPKTFNYYVSGTPLVEETLQNPTVSNLTALEYLDTVTKHPNDKYIRITAVKNGREIIGPQIEPIGAVKPFDFAVLRYIWTNDNGKDLDTRTVISDPPRNVTVGWGVNNADGAVLKWGGDNTASGVESVLIDMSALELAYPEQESFRIDCKAFWYSARYDGNIKVQFETYKGGVMTQSGYDFVNTGGELVQSFDVQANSTAVGSSDTAGEPIAYLLYTPRPSGSGNLYPIIKG